VAFDAVCITDKATFENPGQYSDGIRRVMVNGMFVVREGRFVAGVYPGIGLRTK
jgi:N-acyl-D-aspartate/D-glutamate deacylase